MKIYFDKPSPRVNFPNNKRIENFGNYRNICFLSLSTKLNDFFRRTDLDYAQIQALAVNSPREPMVF